MKTILLVDDDPDVLTFLEESLRSFGYAVIAKPEPRAALSVIEEGIIIDLVVSDYGLPAMDGAAFLAAVKRSLPDVPMIILTGHDTGAIETCLSSRSFERVDYAAKPIGSKVLGRIVKTALDRAEGGNQRPEESRLSEPDDSNARSTSGSSLI